MLSALEPLARAEDGSLEPTCDFDYSEVSRRLGDHEKSGSTDKALPAEILNAEEWSRFGLQLEDVFEFIVPNPKFFNKDGVVLRLLVIAWFVNRDFHDFTLTELATAFGYAKQSLGREVELLKRRFPTLSRVHMKARALA